MRAVVNTAICPLMRQPSRQSERVDEALLGMVVEVLEECCQGWYQISTPYRYQGYAATDCLCFGGSDAWAHKPKKVVQKGVCDVLSAPRVAGWQVETLVRGCLVIPIGEPDQQGWQKIALPDGREGFTKISFLREPIDRVNLDCEETLRKNIVDTALSYLGTHYRWGGKTPLGIDCSGLTSMAYLLNGVTIYRDAQIREGFPLREIHPADRRPADLLFFPGHVALYLGGGRYVHATAFPGSDGVVINSLNPGAPDYRADLEGAMTAVGSIFNQRFPRAYEYRF